MPVSSAIPVPLWFLCNYSAEAFYFSGLQSGEEGRMCTILFNIRYVLQPKGTGCPACFPACAVCVSFAFINTAPMQCCWQLSVPFDDTLLLVLS